MWKPPGATKDHWKHVPLEFCLKMSMEREHLRGSGGTLQSFAAATIKPQSPVITGFKHSCSEDLRYAIFANWIQSHIWKWFEVWFQSDFYSLDVFCITHNATQNDTAKSRVTEVHQSGWAESMLLLAELHEGQDNTAVLCSMTWHLVYSESEMMESSVTDVRSYWSLRRYCSNPYRTVVDRCLDTNTMWSISKNGVDCFFKIWFWKQIWVGFIWRYNCVSSA